MEEGLYVMSLHFEFTGLDAGMTRLPDKTTILRFVICWKEHDMSVQLLAAINATLSVSVRATHLGAKLSSRDSVHDEDHAHHGERG